MVGTDVVNKCYMKKKIYNLPVSSLCRLCSAADETVDHLVNSCPYIAQLQYKRRHDVVAPYIHWISVIAWNAGLSVTEKWWQHKPEDVLENSSKIMRDFTIFTQTWHTISLILLLFFVNRLLLKHISLTLLHQKFVEKKERYSHLCILVNKYCERHLVLLLYRFLGINPSVLSYKRSALM